MYFLFAWNFEGSHAPSLCAGISSLCSVATSGSLWRRCFQPALAKAATSRCAFVLLGLLKQGGETQRLVSAELRSRRKEINAAVKAAEAEEAEVKGAKTLLAALDEAGKTS